MHVQPTSSRASRSSRTSTEPSSSGRQSCSESHSACPATSCGRPIMCQKLGYTPLRQRSHMCATVSSFPPRPAVVNACTCCTVQVHVWRPAPHALPETSRSLDRSSRSCPLHSDSDMARGSCLRPPSRPPCCCRAPQLAAAKLGWLTLTGLTHRLQKVTRR